MKVQKHTFATYTSLGHLYSSFYTFNNNPCYFSVIEFATPKIFALCHCTEYNSAINLHVFGNDENCVIEYNQSNVWSDSSLHVYARMNTNQFCSQGKIEHRQMILVRPYDVLPKPFIWDKHNRYDKFTTKCAIDLNINVGV